MKFLFFFSNKNEHSSPAAPFFTVKSRFNIVFCSNIKSQLSEIRWSKSIKTCFHLQDEVSQLPFNLPWKQIFQNVFTTVGKFIAFPNASKE